MESEGGPMDGKPFECERVPPEDKDRPVGDGDPGGADSDPASKSKFIYECLEAAEFGDGVLFANLQSGNFIFNKSAAEWLKWHGHFWQEDLMGDVLSAVDHTAQSYTAEAVKLSKKIAWAEKKGDSNSVEKLEELRKLFNKRTTKLRTERGRQNCLKFAATNLINPLQVSGDQLDQAPWLLACNNGVVNLRTGEIRPGRPGDFLVRSSPIDWAAIDTPAPAWEDALWRIFEDDEMVFYLQRLFGYGITGLTVEPILPVLLGSGRNGKTTIVEVVGHVLGPLAGPISSDMLLDSGRFTSSDAPSPSIMDLRGLRIAFASEVEDGRRFSASRVKWLSGSDTLIGRAPHDRRNTRFSPTHLLVLMTNHQPDAPMDDFAFWERIHLIPFPFSFVDRPPKADHERRSDKNLTEKLKAEAPGILAWLVRGCLAWQEKGLCPPAKVREATEEYRRSEDLLADFLEERCVEDPSAVESAASLYDAFSEWWGSNVSKKVLSKKKFGRLLGRRFKRGKSSTVQYTGLRLLKT
jgi:putative DNA primase/helicase